jgi:glycosyltransferase involved in cell wall biosynthesis
MTARRGDADIGTARRILMTADAVGGVWQYSLELASGFCANGGEVRVAVMGPAPTEEQAHAALAISGLSLVHGDFRLEWMQDAEADLARAGDWLLAQARDFRPDLVHLNGYAHAALPWERPVVVVAHSCVLSWWRAVHGCEAPAEWDVYRARVQAGLDAADLVVAPTRAFLDTIRSIYSFEAPSCVIWNGRSSAPRAPIDKKMVVMSAGRLWDAAKNVFALAKAAGALDAPVWVAGEDKAGPSGSDALVRLGRLGQREMQQRLSEAMIFAAPARYEPFGLTAVEAGQARCALVLGDIATQRELWDGAALFVHPDDIAGLAGTLRRLLAEPALADSLGARAQSRARRFEARRMVASYQGAYEAMLLAAPRTSPKIAAMPFAGVHSH